jgi:hypothetical protein
MLFSGTVASQNDEALSAAPSAGSTDPRMDFEDPWHLDLSSKLMSQGQSWH